MKRLLADVDRLAWDAAYMLRCHASSVEREFSVQDVKALFDAHARANGVKGGTDTATEYEREAMRRLRESFVTTNPQ